MSQLPDALQALGLTDGLATRRPAVFFDFDGTLSDIVNDPNAATLAPGAGEALQKLAARCPVAVLSGRDLADVTERVGLPGIWYAGSHGFELTAPDGTHHQNDTAAATIPRLEQAATELRDRLGSIPGVVVEHKRFGVAVHYRNAARDRVGEVAAAVRAAGQRDALRVTTGREVIELRPDIDWDKGKTLRWVIDHLQQAGSGPQENLLPIFLGDDITDEDAFDAVRHDGVPILVRHDDDGDRATAALFALDSPARVSQFIERLARQLTHGPRGADETER
jgi:trehalose 6-phosphate phosphatase